MKPFYVPGFGEVYLPPDIHPDFMQARLDAAAAELDRLTTYEAALAKHLGETVRAAEAIENRRSEAVLLFKAAHGIEPSMVSAATISFMDLNALRAALDAIPEDVRKRIAG